MKKQGNNNSEYYTIDVLHIIKSLVKRAWVIAISGVLAALIGFSISAFAIAPTYSSYIKLYVNNSSFSLSNTNFSISLSPERNIFKYSDFVWDCIISINWKELTSLIMLSFLIPEHDLCLTPHLHFFRCFFHYSLIAFFVEFCISPGSYIPKYLIIHLLILLHSRYIQSQ